MSRTELQKRLRTAYIGLVVYLIVMMYRCLHGQTPGYLADHLTPASQVASHLRLPPPTNTSSSFLAVDSAPTAVGLFRLRARRSGTRYQTNS